MPTTFSPEASDLRPIRSQSALWRQPDDRQSALTSPMLTGGAFTGKW
jgi:hypothetical protein